MRINSCRDGDEVKKNKTNEIENQFKCCVTINIHLAVIDARLSLLALCHRVYAPRADSNIHMEWLAFQIVSERFWFRDAQACDDPSLIPPGVLESLSHWLLVLCTTIACPEFTNYIMISPTPACLKYHLCESVCQSPWRVL